MSEKVHTAKLTEAEAIQWIQRTTIIEQVSTRRSILLTYHGDVPENTIFVANGLARALAENNSPTATALLATEALGYHPAISGYLKLSHVYIPLLLALAGAVVFFLGWRMPSSLASHVSIPAVSAKY